MLKIHTRCTSRLTRLKQTRTANRYIPLRHFANDKRSKPRDSPRPGIPGWIKRQLEADFGSALPSDLSTLKSKPKPKPKPKPKVRLPPGL